MADEFNWLEYSDNLEAADQAAESPGPRRGLRRFLPRLRRPGLPRLSLPRLRRQPPVQESSAAQLLAEQQEVPLAELDERLRALRERSAATAQPAASTRETLYDVDDILTSPELQAKPGRGHQRGLAFPGTAAPGGDAARDCWRSLAITQRGRRAPVRLFVERPAASAGCRAADFAGGAALCLIGFCPGVIRGPMACQSTGPALPSSMPLWTGWTPATLRWWLWNTGRRRLASLTCWRICCCGISSPSARDR